MLDVLNHLPTRMACIGVRFFVFESPCLLDQWTDELERQNHDLDFGVTQFMHLKSLCNFPWLLANVLDPGLGIDVPLGDCLKTAIIESSNGVKIGFIGLAEQEWCVYLRSRRNCYYYIDAVLGLTQSTLYHRLSSSRMPRKRRSYQSPFSELRGLRSLWHSHI